MGEAEKEALETIAARLRAEQIDESQSPQHGEHWESWSSGYLTAIDMVAGWISQALKEVRDRS